MIRWASYQQRKIDCIACQMGLPKRQPRIIAPRVCSRFNTRVLAAKLTQSLGRSFP